MKLRTKRLIILWVAVVFIILFLGLRTEKEVVNNSAGIVNSEEAYLYGRHFASTLFTASTYGNEKPLNMSFNKQLLFLPKYKYHFIIATLLISIALGVSIKEKS